MRDYVVVLIVFGSLPLILRKPFFGILVWTWLSMMSPHRLCWSFAYNLPLAQIVAITLIGSFLISKEPKRLPAMSVTWLLGFWWFWWFVTTLTAFYPADAWEDWNRAWKIFLLTFLMFYMLTSRPRMDALVWVIVVSLGYFGVKGGAFTLVGGGSSHVLGPPGSFISGNTEIGLALVMTVPLMRYLQLASNNKWVKIGMIIAMGLTMIAILGTQSRGALLGLLAMTFYLALKSRNKAGMIMLLLLALPVGFLIMPESWYSRMDTIQTYDQDASVTRPHQCLVGRLERSAGPSVTGRRSQYVYPADLCYVCTRSDEISRRTQYLLRGAGRAWLRRFLYLCGYDVERLVHLEPGY